MALFLLACARHRSDLPTMHLSATSLLLTIDASHRIFSFGAYASKFPYFTAFLDLAAFVLTLSSFAQPSLRCASRPISNAVSFDRVSSQGEHVTMHVSIFYAPVMVLCDIFGRLRESRLSIVRHCTRYVAVRLTYFLPIYPNNSRTCLSTISTISVV